VKAGYNKNCLNGGTLSPDLRTGLRLSRINARNFHNYYILGYKLLAIFLPQISSYLQHFVYFCTVSGESSMSARDFVNPFNLFNAYGPGLYQILCKANNKRYIGESANVLDRLAKHTRSLENGVSDCSQLQKDWNHYGPYQFEATTICIGTKWQSREARLEKEIEIICSYKPEEVYNFHPETLKKTTENYRVICDIKGTVYKSIGEASRFTGESATKIRVKLHNNYPGYLIIEKIKHGYEPIIANGKYYSSISEAVAAGEAKDRFEAMRKLKNPKHKDWNYQSPEKYINKSDKK
jgi:hypothetical protein